jgi:hypothetical protein
MGRPRLRWEEDVEKDLWKMKVKRWRQKAVGREEAQQSQEVRKLLLLTAELVVCICIF